MVILNTPRLIITLLKSLDRSFAAYHEAIVHIDKQLGLGSDRDSKDAVKVSSKQQATWPWEEKDIVKILQSFENFKTIFILTLNGETLQLVHTIQEGVK